ncbi:MAG: DUF167 domain-containing protein [Candidatus ainarchaeum sp.]|nr:DUF167 domain-containing protein [Candidatus ainarchaeum sp.]
MEKTVMKLKVSTGKTSVQLKLDENEEVLLIDIKSNPEKGKANKEIIKELKKLFKSEVKILSGLKNKKKVVEICSSKEKIFNKIKS